MYTEAGLFNVSLLNDVESALCDASYIHAHYGPINTWTVNSYKKSRVLSEIIRDRSSSF